MIKLLEKFVMMLKIIIEKVQIKIEMKKQMIVAEKLKIEAEIKSEKEKIELETKMEVIKLLKEVLAKYEGQ